MLSKKQISIILIFCAIWFFSLNYLDIPYIENFTKNSSNKEVNSSINVDNINDNNGSNSSDTASSAKNVGDTNNSNVSATSKVPAVTNPAFKIDKMGYSTDTVIVNEATEFSITLSETNMTNEDRTYYIEVYSSRIFGDFLIGSSTINIASGATSASTAISMKFDTPGDIYTIVKVYNNKGGNVLFEEKSKVKRTINYIIKSSEKLQGVDLVETLTSTQCETLKSKGISFVVRYYSENEAKCVTREEAEAINGAGMQLAVVYQDSNAEPSSFTYALGVEDCKNAINKAIEIGQPTTTPIYFAVDFEANDSTIGYVYDYFKGIAAAMEEFRKNDSKGRFWNIGGYGSYYVVKKLKDNKYVSYTWQTVAWSYGQFYDYDIYQMTPHYEIAGAETDLNVSNEENNNVVGGFYIK